MQALNHTVFGSLVAVTIKEPTLAIPIALCSHFVLDSIPHYGEDPKFAMGTRNFIYRIFADGLASIGIVLLFLSLHPPNPALLVICSFFAILPDFFWPLALHIKHKGPIWAFLKFHKAIQRESRSGIYLEAVWFVITTSLVVIIIH